MIMKNMALATTSTAIPEASSSHSNLVVEERVSPRIKKAQNSVSRTFSTVLEQSKEEVARRIDSAKNEEVGTKKETKAPHGTKKKLIGGSGLDNSKLKLDEKKLNSKIKEKSKYLNKDRSKAQVRQKMASNNAPDQVGIAVNEVLQLAGRPDSRKRQGDLSDNNSVIGRIIDGKHKSNLTSIALRVEVQDKRPEVPKVVSVSRMSRSHSGHTDEEIDREFSSENRPKMADMEIEISPRLEGKDSPRSAATEFARKLDAQAGNEIVKQIKIVLNRASAGEVRINLKPDNLGRVRVQIRLEDNRLRGRFFVESAAAREVLKGALDGLQTKLLESGFSSVDLEMARDDSLLDFRFNSDNPRDRKTLRRDAALELENSIPISAPDGLSENLVNLVI